MKHIPLISLLLAGLITFGCASQTTSDATITAAVKTKLAANADTSAIKIGVETKNGVVTLSGKVPTETEKARAEEVAARTEGVTQVINQIIVDPNTIGATNAGEKAAEAVDQAKEKASEAARTAENAISDTTILTRIKAQLLSGGLTGIDVDVSNGAVLLRGTVRTAAEKERAEVIARTTEGVSSVHSQLVIGQR